jgi:NADH-ubiquinone oxidoreductase chain 2
MGFFAKQQVLYSATHSGYYFISLVAILVSVISASYYLKIIKVMHFDANQSNDSNNANTVQSGNSQIVVLSNSHSFIIASLTLTILFFILKPSILLNSTHLLALSIFTN